MMYWSGGRMSEEKEVVNPFQGAPPWIWIVMFLGGGFGASGVGSLIGGQTATEDLLRIESKVDTFDGKIDTLNEKVQELKIQIIELHAGDGR